MGLAIREAVSRFVPIKTVFTDISYQNSKLRQALCKAASHFCYKEYLRKEWLVTGETLEASSVARPLWVVRSSGLLILLTYAF